MTTTRARDSKGHFLPPDACNPLGYVKFTAEFWAVREGHLLARKVYPISEKTIEHDRNGNVTGFWYEIKAPLTLPVGFSSGDSLKTGSAILCDRNGNPLPKAVVPEPPQLEAPTPPTTDIPTTTPCPFKVGDKVIHEAYGKGIIGDPKEDFAFTAAFEGDQRHYWGFHLDDAKYFRKVEDTPAPAPTLESLMAESEIARLRSDLTLARQDAEALKAINLDMGENLAAVAKERDALKAGRMAEMEALKNGAHLQAERLALTTLHASHLESIVADARALVRVRQIFRQRGHRTKDFMPAIECALNR